MKKKRVPKHKSKKKKKGLKLNKTWKIVVIIAAILIILIAGFFVIRGVVNQRAAIAFTNGYQYGYITSIYTIMNMSMSCQPVPLYAGNVSIDMIAVDCLQPPAG